MHAPSPIKAAVKTRSSLKDVFVPKWWSSCGQAHALCQTPRRSGACEGGLHASRRQSSCRLTPQSCQSDTMAVAEGLTVLK
jgi:hypothetical protein